MKIIHISTFEKTGGASLAANRLNNAFNEEKEKSTMLVLNKTTNKDNIFLYSNTTTAKIYSKIKQGITEKLKNIILSPSYSYSLGISGYNIYKSQLIKEADIIYVHWTGLGYLSIKGLHQILRLNKPTIVYMHDMWFITGGCHHSFQCNLYKEKCSKCPIIKNKYLKSISRFIFSLKKRYLSNFKNLYIVTPSKWLEQCVKESTLFNSNYIKLIPHNIDTNLFKPINKSYSKNILNLPQDKKIILFGAYGGKSDQYKGWKYLVSAMSLLNRNDYVIVMFGGYLSKSETKSFSCPIYSLGYIHDEYSTVLLYNAADVFVTPSLAESFGLTIQESISCGTLAVGFNVGGIPDIIKHKETGYLAKLMDTEDLATGINWALDNSNSISRGNLHKVIKNKYSSKVILNMYKSIFTQFN